MYTCKKSKSIFVCVCLFVRGFVRVCACDLCVRGISAICACDLCNLYVRFVRAICAICACVRARACVRAWVCVCVYICPCELACGRVAFMLAGARACICTCMRVCAHVVHACLHAYICVLPLHLSLYEICFLTSFSFSLFLSLSLYLSLSLSLSLFLSLSAVTFCKRALDIQTQMVK